MTDAMEALYVYAQEYLFSTLLAQEKGYNVHLTREEKDEEKYEEQLHDILDESGQKILDSLIKTKLNITLSNKRAAFQAGIRIALELSR